MLPPYEAVKGQEIALPRRRPRNQDFDGVVSRRRSLRHFDSGPLPLDALAAVLLGAGAVKTMDFSNGTSKRPAASAGGRHPLEIYVLPLRIAGLPTDAAYYFDPLHRSLKRVEGTRDVVAAVAKGFPGQDLEEDTESKPAAVLFLVARHIRTLWKYENMGLLAIYKDVGCLSQLLYLQTCAEGLAGYALGGGPEMEISLGLGLAWPDETYVGAFCLGLPPADGKANQEVDGRNANELFHSE